MVQLYIALLKKERLNSSSIFLVYTIDLHKVAYSLVKKSYFWELFKNALPLVQAKSLLPDRHKQVKNESRRNNRDNQRVFIN
jgi:hypothetical protein